MFMVYLNSVVALLSFIRVFFTWKVVSCAVTQIFGAIQKIFQIDVDSIKVQKLQSQSPNFVFKNLNINEALYIIFTSSLI